MKHAGMWLFFVLLLVACTNPSTSLQSQHFGITVAVSPNGIGTRPITVSLTDSDKKPLRDATLTVTAVMTQHGMMGVPLTLTNHADGTYTSDALDLNMVGEWQLQLQIVQGNLTDTVTIPVVVK
ncbi:MAG: hypothetical protein EBS29_02975 [Chloroflexia bacterium]|nr:hypothetical protein [Chloroflexia bacterium]